ncbi:MAG TPA: hypothetical protein VEC93_13285, partial [Anaerolineae bacterium]|nr:hypothetical protein [Anaerolineae bacterium]
MKNVAGLFESEATADQAINALQEAGFSKNNFSLVARQNRIVQRVDQAEDQEQGMIQADSKLGTAGGAAIGGIAGLLFGVAALAIPGIGPIVAAGSIATALGTATVAAGMGAVAGGLLGAITSLGISVEEANMYAEGVKRGGILLVVEADEAHAPIASQIMQQAGAVDVHVRRETWESTG